MWNHFYSTFELMIDLILGQLKSMLNSKKSPRNLFLMVINMIQIGSHDPWVRMKPWRQSYVDIVKDLQLHSILLKIQIPKEFKWRKTYAFVATVVSAYSRFSFYLLIFFFDLDRATKLIALIRQCEIIVRDANRIHHFHMDGQCSCNDYFWN